MRPILRRVSSGVGGCVMIGQGIINVSSGGRNRFSGIVAALAFACENAKRISDHTHIDEVGLKQYEIYGT